MQLRIEGKENAPHILFPRHGIERQIGVFHIIAEITSPHENDRSRFRIKLRGARQQMNDTAGFQNRHTDSIVLDPIGVLLGAINQNFAQRNRLLHHAVKLIVKRGYLPFDLLKVRCEIRLRDRVRLFGLHAGVRASGWEV